MHPTSIHWLSTCTRVVHKLLQPNLWATATLIASSESDSLSPTVVIGGACSQSPECGDAAARSPALSTSHGSLERIRFRDLLQLVMWSEPETYAPK